MGGMRHGDFQRRCIYGPNHGADERDHSVVNACRPHQDAAIPAINTVIPGTSEDFQRCWNIKWGRKLHRKCRRLKVLLSHICRLQGGRVSTFPAKLAIAVRSTAGRSP